VQASGCSTDKWTEYVVGIFNTKQISSLNDEYGGGGQNKMDTWIGQ
jgi:hypothetical protein